MDIDKIIAEADRHIRAKDYAKAWRLLRPHAANAEAQKRLIWLKARRDDPDALPPRDIRDNLTAEEASRRSQSAAEARKRATMQLNAVLPTKRNRFIAIIFGGVVVTIVAIIATLLFVLPDSEAPAPTVDPRALITDTPTQSIAEARNTIAVEDTATAIVLATVSAVPTSTPTLTYTPSITPSPTLTLTPTPTLTPTLTPIPPTPPAPVLFDSDEEGLKPRIEPASIPSGFYRMTMNSRGFFIADVGTSSGVCNVANDDSTINLSNVAASSGAQRLFISEDCEASITIRNTQQPWTLNFEPLPFNDITPVAESYSSDALGLQPVIGVLSFPEARYTVTVTTDGELIADIYQLSGECDALGFGSMFNISAGEASDGLENTLISDDCVGLLLIRNAEQAWTLTFEPR